MFHSLRPCGFADDSLRSLKQRIVRERFHKGHRGNEKNQDQQKVPKNYKGKIHSISKKIQNGSQEKHERQTGSHEIRTVNIAPEHQKREEKPEVGTFFRPAEAKEQKEENTQEENRTSGGTGVQLKAHTVKNKAVCSQPDHVQAIP
jgi:hypothetical protein